MEQDGSQGLRSSRGCLQLVRGEGKPKATLGPHHGSSRAPNLRFLTPVVLMLLCPLCSLREARAIPRCVALWFLCWPFLWVLPYLLIN